MPVYRCRRERKVSSAGNDPAIPHETTSVRVILSVYDSTPVAVHRAGISEKCEARASNGTGLAVKVRLGSDPGRRTRFAPCNQTISPSQATTGQRWRSFPCTCRRSSTSLTFLAPRVCCSRTRSPARHARTVAAGNVTGCVNCISAEKISPKAVASTSPGTGRAY